MLSSAVAINEVGRVRLPLHVIKANNITYAQPILVTCENNGLRVRYLCTASIASGPVGSFDPSVQCGLHSGPLCLNQGDQLSISIRPITSRPVAATSIKVVVVADLLHSPVPAARLQQRLLQQQCTLYLSTRVSCRVIEVTPAAAAASTVYRVVPSTHIQLVTDINSSSISQGSQLQSSTSQLVQHTAAAAGAAVAGSSDSKAKSRSSSITGSSKSASTSPTGTTQRSEKTKSSSSSSSSIKSKKKLSNRSEGAAIAASASMFDVLDSLTDD